MHAENSRKRKFKAAKKAAYDKNLSRRREEDTKAVSCIQRI